MKQNGNPLTNELLGYPSDARLLIINNDDYGMCHCENRATEQSIDKGIATSCTVMVPCPWSLDAVERLKSRNHAYGIHLTAISEHRCYRWRPLVGADRVPTLIDEYGYFHSEESIDTKVLFMDVRELELEFRAQIEHFIGLGLTPTHLDSHCHVHTRRLDIFRMVMRLGFEYGLAVRAHGECIGELHRLGLAGNGYDVLDSFRIETANKVTHFQSLVRKLQAGLSEWAMHPAVDGPELRGIQDKWKVRTTDLEVLISRSIRETLSAENITCIDYYMIQQQWLAVRQSVAHVLI